MTLEFIKNQEEKEAEEYREMTSENIIAAYKEFLEFLFLLIVMIILERRYNKEAARKRREEIKLKRGYSSVYQP